MRFNCIYLVLEIYIVVDSSCIAIDTLSHWYVYESHLMCSCYSLSYYSRFFLRYSLGINRVIRTENKLRFGFTIHILLTIVGNRECIISDMNDQRLSIDVIEMRDQRCSRFFCPINITSFDRSNLIFWGCSYLRSYFLPPPLALIRAREIRNLRSK